MRSGREERLDDDDQSAAGDGRSAWARAPQPRPERREGGRRCGGAGARGQHSDTGNVTNWLAERAAGPFNHPTEMIAHPNGDIYVTDGYRNARVHRFTRDGRLVKSWGEPGNGAGQFHLPHSIAYDDDGKLYVADRSNKRIQIFTPEGEFLGQWTGMGGPNDITRGRDGNFYIAE